MNAETTPGRPSTADFVAHIRNDSELFAEAVETGPLTAPVDGCPGWDLRQLTAHMALIHRWAAYAAAHREPPPPGTIPKTDPDATGPELAQWLRAGAEALAETLAPIDPDEPTWHAFPVPMVAAVWPRRQAHETAIHRWDAQAAVGTPGPIDADFASDGIDEFLTIALPRAIAREAATPPTGSLHIHCTDVAGEWLAWFDDDGYHLVREHRKGDAAMRGPAEPMLLMLYGRAHDADALTSVGDDAVVQRWLDLPGL